MSDYRLEGGEVVGLTNAAHSSAKGVVKFSPVDYSAVGEEMLSPSWTNALLSSSCYSLLI